MEGGKAGMLLARQRSSTGSSSIQVLSFLKRVVNREAVACIKGIVAGKMNRP